MDIGIQIGRFIPYMLDNIELLGWLATAILLIGYYLNAKQLRESWLVWVIGNTFMGIYAYMIDSMSVVCLSVVLIGLNVYGYNSWKNNKF